MGDSLTAIGTEAFAIALERSDHIAAARVGTELVRILACGVRSGGDRQIGQGVGYGGPARGDLPRSTFDAGVELSDHHRPSPVIFSS